MSNRNFDDDLERRLRLLEDSTSGEQVLDNLPVRDVIWAVLGLAVVTIVLLAWGYPR